MISPLIGMLLALAPAARAQAVAVEQAHAAGQTLVTRLQLSQELLLESLVRQRNRARGRVEALERNIERMTVKAPQAGIVVYRTNWNDEKKKIGDSVWSGEKLLGIPDRTFREWKRTAAAPPRPKRTDTPPPPKKKEKKLLDLPRFL